MPKSKAKMKMNRNKKAAAKENDASASQEIRQEKENPLKRLPNDLMISHIFGKIPEVKSLFMCSLVSKHFASLILKTHNLSFVFPVWIRFYRDLNPRIPTSSVTLKLPPRFQIILSNPRKFLKQLRRPTKQKPSVSSPEKFFSSMYFGFLQKLSFIENLNIEVSSTRNYESSDFSLTWVCDYKHASAWSFIILVFKNLVRANPTEIDDEVLEGLNRFDSLMLPSSIRYQSCDAHFRFKLLKSMVEGFPYLKSAVVSDSIKDGKLIVREEALAEMRTQYGKEKEKKFFYKWWCEPVLKLPISGFVMEGANLGILKMEGTGDYDDIAKDSFEGEEVKAFGEAALKLLKTEEVLKEDGEIRFVNGEMDLVFSSDIEDS